MFSTNFFTPANPSLRDFRASKSAKFCDGKGLEKVVNKLT